MPSFWQYAGEHYPPYARLGPNDPVFFGYDADGAHIEGFTLVFSSSAPPPIYNGSSSSRELSTYNLPSTLYDGLYITGVLAQFPGTYTCWCVPSPGGAVYGPGQAVFINGYNGGLPAPDQVPSPAPVLTCTRINKNFATGMCDMLVEWTPVLSKDSHFHWIEYTLYAPGVHIGDPVVIRAVFFDTYSYIDVGRPMAEESTYEVHAREPAADVFHQGGPMAPYYSRVFSEVVRVPALLPIIKQSKVRGRNDDGGESSATWKQPANVSWQQRFNENFRVRCSIDEVGDMNPPSKTFKIQTSIDGSTWNDLTTTGFGVHLSDSPNVTDGAATTQQLGAALDGGTFVPGSFHDVTQTAVADLAASGKVEHEWCMIVPFVTPAVLADPTGGSMVVPFATQFTAVPLPPNIDVSGVLDDTDPLYGTQGGPTDFLKLVVIGAGPCELLNTVGSFDTYGYLYDNAGTLIEENDDSASGFRWMIRRTLPVGTYWIGTSAYDEGRGPWTVRANPIITSSLIAGTELHFRVVESQGFDYVPVDLYDEESIATVATLIADFVVEEIFKSGVGIAGAE